MRYVSLIPAQSKTNSNDTIISDKKNETKEKDCHCNTHNLWIKQMKCTYSMVLRRMFICQFFFYALSMCKKHYMKVNVSCTFLYLCISICSVETSWHMKYPPTSSSFAFWNCIINHWSMGNTQQLSLCIC